MLVFSVAFVVAQSTGPLPRLIHIPSYFENSSGLQTIELDGGVMEIEVGDVNGDGHMDLVSIGDHGSPYVNTQEHGIMVWRGDGLGGWTLLQTGDFGYGGIALGDVNNDTFLDVGYGMHHNYSSTDFGDQLLEVALGDGTAVNWTPWDDGLAQNGETWGMSATDFADVDHDGDLDIGSISFGCCAGIHVYLNQGNGTWIQSFGFLGGNSRSELFFHDVNNDGHADLIVGHALGTVYLGTGTGGFMSADQGLPAPGFLGLSGLDCGDVDGNGTAELSLVNTSGGIELYEFLNGSMSWHPVLAQGLPLVGQYEATQLADMNSDGRMDVVAFGNGQGDIYLGNLNGTFVRAAGFQTGNPGSAETLRVDGDIDHNGYPDIFVLAEEGGLFNRKNTLRFYQEGSSSLELRALLTEPEPNRVLIAGSKSWIRWVSAFPYGTTSFSAELEFSSTGPQGPWTPISGTIRNSGRFEWTVPTVVSPDCYLRLQVRTPFQTKVTRSIAAFEIR